jgi:hypothetical protein
MPPPTALALRQLSALVGRPLPDAYLEFISKHNGAEPEANSLDGEGNISVRRFIPVEEVSNVLAAVEGFPSRVIPLAEDDCGNFTYVQPATGEVYFWDHEVVGDEKIAANVPDFIFRLLTFDAGAVEPGQVVSTWIDPDFLASLNKGDKA